MSTAEQGTPANPAADDELYVEQIQIGPMQNFTYVLGSNRTREVHDALKRRCLYHWVDYPGFERELEILNARVPEASAQLSREVVAFVQRLRDEDLFKKPGVAETIDWAKCLLALDVIQLSPEVIADTLGAVLKYQDDIQKLQGLEARKILDDVRKGLTA